MNTNIDTGGIPDAAFLEKLANQYFKANPADELPGQGPIPATVPSSVSGLGVSPSVVQYGNTVDIKDTENDLPKHYSDGGGRIPVSVAGSGASPSVVQHGNNINIKNPQTGFPDQNLKNGDHNAAGAFTDSPANGSKEYFPFEGDKSFLTDLQTVLSSLMTSSSAPQFPELTSKGLDTQDFPAYYFLQDNPFAISGNIAQLPTDSISAVKPGFSTASVLPWGFDANLIKKDFPILQEVVNGKPIVWLDNAATTQKPRQVIERLSFFYEHENSNIHRAAHELAARATDAYEEARKKVQLFLNAASPNEIVFVRGTTEAINLVAKSWGEQYLQPGDEIIVTHLEHHANIVPWQQLAGKKGVKLRVIPVDDDGQVLLDEYARLLNPKTRLVSFTQVSNALGTVTPARKMIEMAHQAGAKVLLDGAQSVSHMRADVQALDADWFVFSGHKVFGPTGIGVLYGKEDLLNQTEPWQGGGNMIRDVTFEHTEFQKAPGRFEAGTGNIADAVGLGAAIDYVTRLGIENIQLYEHYLLQYATGLLNEVPGLKLIGTAKEKTSVLSFVLNGYSNDQVGQALNNEGIAVRTGHHCAQPILRRFGLESTVRPSLAFYNTCTDVDRLVSTLKHLKGKYR
ncbi:family 2A encapsulin nanocompartment cargo protein cysteine desulfurase [Flavihumibacter profundi]|uniref:family 2A encapsulin nanocompartment cargo protein cysteine desulfurase n=1 Tax=Flavihumibacter profundi TaxID=2716883 RepID=UPI001CC41AD3|nr:family 2A encapsulin nanocompartment cargo protein cysteine desulfurase [Flavihumibacter profundi]MBZ5859307.1 cysteine desulfurase [Flavihumibacter profundi]